SENYLSSNSRKYVFTPYVISEMTIAGTRQTNRLFIAEKFNQSGVCCDLADAGDRRRSHARNILRSRCEEKLKVFTGRESKLTDLFDRERVEVFVDGNSAE